MIKLSVIIPAYNEAKNIKNGVLNLVSEYLKGVDYTYEVIIVDDGSTDKTVEEVEKFIQDKKNWRIIKASHSGKALTVIRGLLESNGEITVFTDMDQATPLNQIEKFFPKFEEDLPAGRQGYDIVIGSRHGREGAPFIRKLAAWIFSLLRGVILGLPFADTQCGFKAFNKESIEKIVPKIKDEWGSIHFKGGAVNAGFDVELLYLAKKYGFKIAEEKVEWNYVDTERVQVIKDALAAIYDMLRIRWNDLTGKY